MSKFRDGMLGPTVILFAICFLITLALAAVYNMTESTIAASEAAAANAARMEVLPEADGFTKVEGVELPEGVDDVYRADNGVGFVFTSQAKGFGGPVVYVVGMDSEGGFTGINMFSHGETPGLGTKIGEASYLEKYRGDVDVDGVEAVTGATRTTNSLKNSLKQAQEAFQLVKEAA